MVNLEQSDSSVQQNAEIIILKKLENKFKANFDKASTLPIKTGVKIDGVDVKNKILVEVYARIGKIKPAQANKIKGDILKLKLVSDLIENGDEWRKILCFVSDESAKYCLGKSWVAEAIKQYGFEVIVIDIDNELRNNIISAQYKQKMVNQ